MELPEGELAVVGAAGRWCVEGGVAEVGELVLVEADVVAPVAGLDAGLLVVFPGCREDGCGGIGGDGEAVPVGEVEEAAEGGAVEDAEEVDVGNAGGGDRGQDDAAGGEEGWEPSGKAAEDAPAAEADPVRGLGYAEDLVYAIGVLDGVDALAGEDKGAG